MSVAPFKVNQHGTYMIPQQLHFDALMDAEQDNIASLMLPKNVWKER